MDPIPSGLAPADTPDAAAEALSQRWRLPSMIRKLPTIFRNNTLEPYWMSAADARADAENVLYDFKRKRL